jgi:hypothetical protein
VDSAAATDSALRVKRREFKDDMCATPELMKPLSLKPALDWMQGLDQRWVNFRQARRFGKYALWRIGESLVHRERAEIGPVRKR